MPVSRRSNHPDTGSPRGEEEKLAEPYLDSFISAGTFKQVLTTYRKICDCLKLSPSPINSFYPKLKSKLSSWRAEGLWTKLDKRAAQKEYMKGRACENTRVLIIGAGPVGLRTAIEAQMLGAKVVVLEKRDRLSRNNVLHLWPFVISDLRQLGAKKFFGKFCAGSIDHISIRQLQLILLKVSLLLGVEIYENVTFEDLIEPTESLGEKGGWRAKLNPRDHEASNYEFDFLVCADGKRNTIKGFSRNEFRGKLAIGITANFINRQTQEENKVPEISGVTFIFNQKFFRDMHMKTGIDLENIVYYKDDTHYFVMTAKKQSLIERGVIIHDQSDVASLLKPDNVNSVALLEYAKDAARFATKDQLPFLEFAVNHYGRPDVAMFDFTSMYASENASRVVERSGKKLMLCLVGDSLLEPFWPTGSGCARGFLSALDTAWMLKNWEAQPPIKVIAERESIYRLLNQTTPETINKDFNHYTINPVTRYMNLGSCRVLPGEVKHLCDLETLKFDIPDTEMQMTSMARKRIRNRSIVNPDSLQLWCEKQVYQYGIRIEDMSSSWRDGKALTAILHRYRPELIEHPSELDADEVARNCQRVFDLFEKEYQIPPVMTGSDMEASDVPDKLTMVSYLTQVYEIFRGAIPKIGRPVYKFADLLEEHESSKPVVQRPDVRAAVESYRGSRVYEEQMAMSDVASEISNPVTVKKPRMSAAFDRFQDRTLAESTQHSSESHLETIDKARFSECKEKMQNRIAGRELEPHCAARNQGISRKSFGITQRPSIRELQKQLLDLEKGKPRSDAPPGHYVGKIGKDDWNFRLLEERLKEREAGSTKEDKKKVEKPKVFGEIFHDRRRQIETRLHGGSPERAKYGVIDEQLQKVERQLKDGGVIMGAGERGKNKVAELKNILDVKAQENRPRYQLNPPKVNKYLKKEFAKQKSNGSSSDTSCEDLPGNSSEGSEDTDMPPTTCTTDVVKFAKREQLHIGRQPSPVSQESSDLCYFCGQRVYLIDRLSAEGHFFHRSCLRCEYCGDNLRLGSYAYDSSGMCKGKFYCVPHFRMEKPSERWSQMMRQKERFLQEEPVPARILPKKVEPILQKSPDQGTSLDMHAIPGFIDMNRDRTPERAEFENLGDESEYDEDDLLNSELEEEELTQRNLGVTDVQTDDDLDDISTDEDDDELIQVAVQAAEDEDCHRSFTADATRHFAETWSKKHNQSCCESSENTDEESSTEKDEGATTDDVDSDYEYASDSHPSQAGTLRGEVDKSSATHEEVSDRTEMDYSTVRRRKTAIGASKKKATLKDGSPERIDESSDEVNRDQIVEDEGAENSTEDGVTLSITDSSDEDIDIDDKAKRQVPRIVILPEPSPQRNGDDLWGVVSMGKALSGCDDSPDDKGLFLPSGSSFELTPDSVSPVDELVSTGGGSLTEVTDTDEEIKPIMPEVTDVSTCCKGAVPKPNPRVPPRASRDSLCDQLHKLANVHCIAHTASSNLGSISERQLRPNTLVSGKFERGTAAIDPNISPASVSSASGASPEMDSINRLDDVFPIIQFDTACGPAPVAGLGTSDDEELTMSEWAKEDLQNLSTNEDDLNIQNSLKKRQYTRGTEPQPVSVSLEDLIVDPHDKKITTTSTAAMNTTTETDALDDQTCDHLVTKFSQIENIQNYRTLPSKTHTSILGNMLERSSSTDRIHQANLKSTTEKKSGLPTFSGYGGSFAEKVRQPTESDQIYLKSLNLKFKKLDFPSIRSGTSSQKGSRDDLLSEATAPLDIFKLPAEPGHNDISTPLDHSRNVHPSKGVRGPSSQSLAHDPVAALTQMKAANEASIYENVKNLPYFDDRMSIASFKNDAFPLSESSVVDVREIHSRDSQRFRTGSMSSLCSVERERARQEARERAKLKSDAELGITTTATPQSAMLRRHRGRFGSEDLGEWEVASYSQRAIADHRPQSDCTERVSDLGILNSSYGSPRESQCGSGLNRKETATSATFKCLKESMASGKKRLFSSGENSLPKAVATNQTRPNSAGSKAKNAFFSLLNFGAKAGSQDQRDAIPKGTVHRSSLSQTALPINSGTDSTGSPSSTLLKSCQSRSSLTKNPSKASTISARLKILSPKTNKSPRGSIVSIESSESRADNPLSLKKNVSLDSLKSVVESPAAGNGPKLASDFSVDLSSMCGSMHEMRLGRMGMSTLISGTDLLCESDDNDTFLDVQDVLNDKRVEADKAERFQQRVYKQQELKRIRRAQEVQRKLEEIEVARAGIEQRGVEVEKQLRKCCIPREKDTLSQELFELLRQKNKLNRQEQELMIRAKDLELENRHAKLQKEMRERMAIDDANKSEQDVEDERKILREMLEILEKRDKLVVLLDQLELKQLREDREIENRMKAAQRGVAIAANTLNYSNV